MVKRGSPPATSRRPTVGCTSLISKRFGQGIAEPAQARKLVRRRAAGMVGAVHRLIECEMLLDNPRTARQGRHRRLDADGVVTKARVLRKIYLAELEVNQWGRILGNAVEEIDTPGCADGREARAAPHAQRDDETSTRGRAGIDE